MNDLSIFKKLKKIHPSLKWIRFDDYSIQLVMVEDDGYECEMEIQEFMSGFETYNLMLKLHEALTKEQVV